MKIWDSVYIFEIFGPVKTKQKIGGIHRKPQRAKHTNWRYCCVDAKPKNIVIVVSKIHKSDCQTLLTLYSVKVKQ